MATIDTAGFTKGKAAEMLTPTENCFYCSRRLSGERFVYWKGSDERGQEIWLHVGCAINLAHRLIADAEGRAR